jgi:hypothetical protein
VKYPASLSFHALFRWQLALRIGAKRSLPVFLAASLFHVPFVLTWHCANFREKPSLISQMI